MKLYLMQHGEAVSAETNPDRPLSEKGKADVLKTAALLNNIQARPHQIWHSAKLRAIGTAILIGEVLGLVEICEKVDGLSPNDPVEATAKKIKQIAKDVSQDLMIVGHQPFLGKLASSLMTGRSGSGMVTFRQGGAVCLELKDNDLWSLEWAVVPDLLQ